MVLSKALHKGIQGLQGMTRTDMINPGYSEAMALSTFGALIPTTLRADALGMMTRACYYYQYRFDRAINDGKKEFATRDTIMKYANTQINSTLYSSEERRNHCTSFELIRLKQGIYVLTDAAKVGVATAAAV